MEEKTKKSRHDGEVDRLSDLPDGVLLHILSFVDTVDAVKTCVLSKRWRHLWRHIPALILNSSQFCRVDLFRKFMSKVISGRDGDISLRNLNLGAHSGYGRVQTQFLDRVINYAVSHNVEHLTLFVRDYCPPCLFSSLSLTSLTIENVILPKSLDLPALTSLHLGNGVSFLADDNGRAEPFGNCRKLNTLVIEEYRIEEPQGVPGILCIANDALTNLIIGKSYYKHYASEIELFTPNLRSFAVKGNHWNHLIQFGGQKLDSLEVADIDIIARNSVDISRNALILMAMLQLLSNVESMTITSNTLKVLSNVYASLETQRPCFSNLKLLKVVASCWDRPDGVLDYLLQNSPMAEVTVIRQA